MSRFMIPLVLFIVFFSTLSAQIEFKANGKIYRAIVIKDINDVLTLKDETLEPYSLNRTEISEIKHIKCGITRISEETSSRVQNYGKSDSTDGKYIYFKDDNGHKYKFHPQFIETIHFIDEDNERLYSFGVVAGYPSILSFNYSFKSSFSNSFGGTISLGMNTIDANNLISTIRSNIYYNIVNRRYLELNTGLSVSFPLKIIEDKMVRSAITNNAYFGPYFDINFFGLYLNTGLGINSRDETFVMYNIGYMYRFNSKN